MNKSISFLLLGLCAITSLSCASEKREKTLKEALQDKFYIGTALNRAQYLGRTDSVLQEVITTQFNSVVAENCMKSGNLQPTEGNFFFEDADRFIAYGEKHNMHIVGHTLIWHSQAPRWFFTNEQGETISPEELTERMRNHIYSVVGRYKGKVKGWDVVNEAIMEDGSYRNSRFYQILGEEFIPLAFQFAHEADPDAELYYNDYNEWYKGKRTTVMEMVKDLKSRGLRIDGIGMQGHIAMDSPSLHEYEKSLLEYASLGVKVMVTELDMSILPSPRPGGVGADIATNFEYQQQLNPYTEGVPEEVMAAWTARMQSFFQLFLTHADKIDRITMWGTSDKESWKNGFPVRGRTDYPLLFDRQYQPKAIVQQIIEEALKR